MQRYVYKLEKEEYMDWIRYEAQCIDNPVMRRKYYLLGMCVITAVLIVELLLFGSSSTVVYLSFGLGAAILLGFIGIMSPKNRLNTLYVQAGLDKVEKKNMFPTITLEVGERELTFRSDKDTRVQRFRYSQIREILPMEHIIMLKMDDEKWQFVAKDAFPTTQDCISFQKLLQSGMSES